MDIKKVVKDILDDPYNYAHKISIDDLVKILKTLSHHYYSVGTSLVPDDIFDIMRDVLEERDPKNKLLREVGAPVVKGKVKLPYSMPSLNKIKPSTNILDKWLKLFRGPFVISDKLDGVSALLVKENNKFKMYTRGDGENGQDISYLIKYIIRNTIDVDNVPNNGAIRGELIISKNKFKKISNQYSNARNTVSGVVNAKHYNRRVAKMVDFVAYAVLNPNYRIEKQMRKLGEWNVPTVHHKTVDTIDNNMLSDYLIKRREESAYDIDGIVVIDSAKAYSTKNKNPKYGFAFKTILKDQIAEAKVLDVEWNVSMHGYLKPRVKVEPIVIGNVNIQYATAFNAKFVVDNVLGPGAVIQMVRSGDVIPKIEKVIKPAATGKPKMPTIPYKWTKTKVDIVVQDIHGDAADNIKIKRIAHFFKVLDVKYLGQGIVKKLVNAGYKRVIDIIRADPDKLAEIDGLGESIVKKIRRNTQKAFEIVILPQLMAASNVFGVGFGRRKLKMVTDVYPDIMKKTWDVKKLQRKIENIEGYNVKTAKRFAKHLSDFRVFYNKLKKVVDLSHLDKIKKIDKSKHIFAGKSLVFTGFRNKDLEKKIVDLGGKVSISVSKRTYLVIFVQPAGKPPSSKLKKSKSLGLTMIEKDDFIKKFGL